jgi:CubicO group peptidase (beta-lactamase class C family)
MSLVEEGKLHLSDPLERYIPAFKNMKVAVPSSPGDSGAAGASPPRYTMEPARRAITIKDLLTHVSGLGSGPISQADIERVARKEGETLADYIPRLGSTVLEFQPGSRWNYSPGAGFETLGRIVEIASGERLDRFLRARIFDPLAMKDIAFWPTDAQWPRVATVYRLDGAGLVKAPTPNDNSSRNVYFRGSGGLYSTAEDYMPFGLMLANGGELNGARVLGRKSVEMLAAVHAPDTLPGLPPGQGYGLSVRVVTNHALGGTLLSDGTYGWSGAQGTHFFVDPKEDLVGVLMVQTSNAELRREFEDLVAQSVVD